MCSQMSLLSTLLGQNSKNVTAPHGREGVKTTNAAFECAAQSTALAEVINEQRISGFYCMYVFMCDHSNVA